MKLKFYFVLICLVGTFLTVSAQESAASLYNDGLAKLKEKNYQEALTSLEKAIEVADPEADKKVVGLAKRNCAFACYYVGNGLRKSEDYDGAIEMYEKGISYSTSVYNNYSGKAQALEGKGDLAGSVQAYIKAADMTEKVGKKSIESGKEERGQKLIDRADKMVKKAANFSAKAYSAKNWDNTIATAQAFLDVREGANPHYYMAMALKAKGKGQEALTHVDKALEMAEDADKGKMYFGKGQIHEALGQKSQAIEAYGMVKDTKYAERAKYNAEKLGGGR